MGAVAIAPVRSKEGGTLVGCRNGEEGVESTAIQEREAAAAETIRSSCEEDLTKCQNPVWYVSRARRGHICTPREAVLTGSKAVLLQIP